MRGMGSGDKLGSGLEKGGCSKNINGPKLTLTIPEGNEKENCKFNE
jgi:hypothetical protein